MAFAVIAAVILLLAAYFAIAWALEKAGWIKLEAPKGGWPRRERRDAPVTPSHSASPPRGGGNFGGGGASGDW